MEMGAKIQINAMQMGDVTFLTPGVNPADAMDSRRPDQH